MIVDTITKEKIAENNKLSETLKYEVSLPQEAYYEALQHFIGYSQENVLTFCGQQVNNYMEPLKGSKDDRDKKYIEELYQGRKTIAALLVDCRILFRFFRSITFHRNAFDQPVEGINTISYEMSPDI